MHDLQYGAVRVKTYDRLFFTPDEGEDLAQQAQEFLTAPDKTEFLESLTPQNAQYKSLRKALVSYRLKAQDQPAPQISNYDGKIIYLGDKNDIIPQIRARLNSFEDKYNGRLAENNWRDEGRLKLSNPRHKTEITEENGLLQTASFSKAENTSAKIDETYYDAELGKKIAEFQYSNGLKTDAVIGPATIAALNQGDHDKVNKIRASLERMRWLPKDLGDKHILINIPAFYASAVREGKEEFKMPVIVGKGQFPTPIFSSVISNVKMQPDWTSPDSITKRYTLPKIVNNPDIVYALGYQLQNKRTGEIISWDSVDFDRLMDLNISNYQIRQKPGRANALGLARISIENPHAIFMHGTPDTQLFDRANRSFSSGCIRLQDPLKMAKFVLKDEENYSESKVESLYSLNGQKFGDTKFLSVKKKLPVHITYLTAWADENGNTHFAPDIYGRDKKLLSASMGL